MLISCCLLLLALVCCFSAALSAFDRALAIHRQRQQAVQEHNAARQRERQKLLEQQGDELAAELLQDIGEDQEVPQLPAKLLNNAAVLKYRWAWHGCWVRKQVVGQMFACTAAAMGVGLASRCIRAVECFRPVSCACIQKKSVSVLSRCYLTQLAAGRQASQPAACSHFTTLW